MAASRKYMAASVPRNIRQTRLGYLPPACVIGTRILKGNGGANLYYDVVMLPEPEFVRMKSSVGLQVTQAPTMGGALNSAFTLADTKHVLVPEEEADPAGYAKNHFITAFGLATPEGRA